MTNKISVHQWVITVVVGIAFLMESLDVTIVTTAIPDMANALHVDVVQLNIAISAYILTMAIFIPISGWCADRFGSRKIFVTALTVFTFGSILCGVSNDFSMLIISRIIQGLGGALMTPVGRLILLNSFPRSQLVKAMTYTTLPALIGPIIGPLLGGYLTTYISWRWIFFVNIPFGVIGIFLALRFLSSQKKIKNSTFDFKGYTIFAVGIGLVEWALESVNRGFIVKALTFMGLAIFLIFIYWRRSRFHTYPAVDLRLLKQRAFGIATLGGGLSRIAMNGPVYLIPLLLQIGLGMSPMESGAFTFLSVWGVLLVRLLIGRMLRFVGFRMLLVGGALSCSVVLASFALIHSQTPLWFIAMDITLFGLVRAVQFMTSNTLAYAEIEEQFLSRATSLGGLLQQLTVTFGVSASAVFLSFFSKGSSHPSLNDFHYAFLSLAILPLFSLPLILRLHQEDGALVSGQREKAPSK